VERGRTIADRFVIEDRLGEGGMGKVYRARQINAFGRMVAVKVIREDEGADATLREMFENEGAAHARLSHPNVVQLHEFGHEQGLLYIASQLVEGLNLREVLDRSPGRRLPGGQAATVTAQILRGLGAAHGAGLVHRDMKPENVFVSWTGNVLVGDFGLAKSYLPGRTPSMSGGLKGTPLYIPPEVLRGQAWTYRSDL
jgi:serine/threonine-protein kinase